MFTSNNKSTLTNYIKNKLKDEYILDIPYFKIGMTVFKGERYRIDDAVVIVTEKVDEKGANPNTYSYFTASFEGEALPKDNTGRVIHYFRLLKKIWQLSKDTDYKHYVSNTSYYDTLTHFYVGKYLEYLKDYKNLDLFHMYNVWSGQTLSNFYLTYKVHKTVTKTKQRNEDIKEFEQFARVWEINRVTVPTACNLLKIDILPNQDYTLFIESDLPVLMCVVAYDHGKILGNDYVYYDEVYNYMQYRNPKTFKVTISEVNTFAGTSAAFKDYLTLLIQLPKKCKKFLILKGIHTELPRLFDDRIILDKGSSRVEEGGSKISEVIANNQLMMVPDSSLEDASRSYVNGFEQIAVDKYIKNIPNIDNFNYGTTLSDTIMQYIVDYAVTDKESDRDNILELQEKLASSAFRRATGWTYKQGLTGEFNNTFRKWLYDVSKGVKLTELTGFVDKDIEEYINSKARS